MKIEAPMGYKGSRERWNTTELQPRVAAIATLFRKVVPLGKTLPPYFYSSSSCMLLSLFIWKLLCVRKVFDFLCHITG
jgi:hypothetical protein